MTGSAVVRETVAQLNQQEIPVSKNIRQLGDGLTARLPIGRWRHDSWIRDINVMNSNGVALSDVDTDILLKKCAADDCEMGGTGPATPTTLLGVEGFATNNFPANTALWGEDFDDAAGGNCDAVTEKRKGFHVKAGEILYLEFINNEGGPIDLDVTVTLVNTDYISLQPDDLQRNVPYPSQQFHTRMRKED
jgi:hypothetical protein